MKNNFQINKFDKSYERRTAGVQSNDHYGLIMGCFGLSYFSFFFYCSLSPASPLFYFFIFSHSHCGLNPRSPRRKSLLQFAHSQISHSNRYDTQQRTGWAQIRKATNMDAYSNGEMRGVYGGASIGSQALHDAERDPPVPRMGVRKRKTTKKRGKRLSQCRTK